MEHPLFWNNHQKLDFLCKISERIQERKNRDQDSTNFLDEFKDIVKNKLPALQWDTQLPTRSSWGGPTQKTPQKACSSPEGSSLGLIRFVRNVWTHRIKSIQQKHFTSEDEICQIFLGCFPWLVTEIYCLTKKHFALNLKAWLEDVMQY